MKNFSFSVLVICLLAALGCIKKENLKTPAQVISSAFSLEQITDFTNLDILVIDKSEPLNQSSSGSYDLFMQFSQNGTGHGSQLRAQGKNLVVKPSGNYYEDIINIVPANELLVDYQKSTSNSVVGDFTLNIANFNNLDAKASFNLELGLSKTQDLEITWTPDPANQDGKVFIALCVAGSPCQFYESTDQGSFTIPSAKLSDFVSGRLGNIAVTRVLESDVVTNNGEKLKLLKTTSALSFSFEVL
jgi:hypothetical protein